MAETASDPVAPRRATASAAQPPSRRGHVSMTAATADADRRPTSIRIATVAALAGGVFLLVKVALIIATANNVPDALEGGLYLAGVLVPLFATAGIAVAVAPRAGKLAKVGLGVLVALVHAFYITMLSDSVGALVQQFTDEAYLTDEVPVAVLGLVWVLVGWWLRGRDSRA